ncbi:MAG TPA: sigma 54-interacting transcriptional regulator [Pyrinomonadaceae bacterium]
MHWVTHVLSATAVACVTLAFVHIFVWLREPIRRTHLLFFIAALSVAAITPFEWLMVRAQTPEQFGSALRWIQVPLTFAVVALVWFLWLRLGTCCLWLALSAAGLRVLSMLLGFWFTPNVHFRKITEVRHVSLFGGEIVSAPIGIVSPWAVVPQLSAWVLLIFVIYASIKIWRSAERAERRGVLIVAGATMVFVITAAGQGALILTGVLVSPPFISFPFLAIILAMAFELSQDVIRATRLARVVKSNEERLALAQEAAEIGTFDWDIQTGKVLWNENLESIYGFRGGNFGGRSEDWQKRVHPDDLSRCEADIAESIRDQRSGWQSEYRMFRADTNEMRWIYAKARFFYDADGKPTRMLGINMDITDRKVAETARRSSELKFSGIVNSAMDAIVSVDESQHVVLFNSAAEKMFGYAATEMIGKKIDILIPEQYRPAHAEHLRSFGEAGVTSRAMGRLQPIYGRKSDGTEFPIEASISQIKSNGERIYTVIMRDITERKRAEEAVQTSEAKFRNMADTAPVLIWVSGPDKLCTYFNQGWLRFTGRQMEEELGSGWTEGIHPEDLARCLDSFDTAFESRQPLQIEYRLRAATGEYRWIYDSGTPRFSSEGEFLGFIGTCIDITDRKRTEESIKKAHAELNELKNQLQAENIVLQEEIRLAHPVTSMVGQSKAIQYVQYKIGQVAQTDSTVLILGETGTGKELVARAIHEQSKRKDRSLIRVNCAALSPTLIESELFGHERGAFTGAAARKIGRFELANHGTLFLDEIGELPLELQTKLLRVLQEGEFERLGSSHTIKVDVRIIAATNRNMEAAIEKGVFREDLWYRLNVFPITVPPLRQHREDIPLLVEHFAKAFSVSLGKPINEISAATMRKLCDYSWPGNIRELANVVERGVINSTGPVLHIADQFASLSTSESASTQARTLAEIERDYIIRVLEEVYWKIEGPSGAAAILGLNPSTLRTRMAKLGIRRSAQVAQR